MDISILTNNLETIQLISQYLISGKTIYYSDNIESRLGNYSNRMNSNKLHEFGSNLYNFLSNNYETIKKLMDFIGYDLIRNQLTTLSNIPENQYYFFLQPLSPPIKIKSDVLNRLNQGDVLLISSLILESNNGSIFIDYNSYLDRLVNEPENVLKTNINFTQFLKIISPNSRKSGKTKDNLKFLKDILNKKYKNLSKQNFIQIIQNNQKMDLVSLGPSAFRFINQFRINNSNQNSKKEEEE